MMTMTPLASAGMDKEIIEGKEIVDPVFGDAPARTIDDFGTRANTGASGRAPCNAVQTDAGSAGDAGNTSTTAKSLGTDPSNGPTGVTGCVDANDPEDMYSITTTSGKDVDVELVVPTGADFDLYIVDSTKNPYAYDWSEYNDPLEKVSTASTNLSGQATTFYIWVNMYSGDGQYTLRAVSYTHLTLPTIE